MKRVEIKLNLDAVAPLLDAVKSAADTLEPRLAVEPQVPEHEPDFAASWRDELLGGQRSDLAVLLGLFGSEFFATGIIVLDEQNGEPVLRACAAVRLRLRELHLRGLDDGSPESGEVELEELPEAQSRAFAAYVFLATLQEVIIQHLDPTEMD